MRSVADKPVVEVNLSAYRIAVAVVNRVCAVCGVRIGREQGFFGQYHRVCTFLPVAVKVLYQIIAAAEYVEQPAVAAAFDGLFGSGAVCGKMGDDLFSGNVDAACVCGRCAAAYRNIDGGSQADMAAETADAEADRASARAAGTGGEEGRAVTRADFCTVIFMMVLPVWQLYDEYTPIRTMR